ncbi:DUF5924 family protein [Acanthopleuribacter pedis]|uniref:DUF2914 domain-containing protein n=1 Tax=Acanthopleuribacter pedis TaxID=442870 RepID=A0A8J7U2P9_9BACT|nr:DUF2914 domain-containing protein [Acanthopleuribacter pedis]MBO1318797.1 DUF2914 domain-containing protein [Acanthopleuribacter pedis]
MESSPDGRSSAASGGVEDVDLEGVVPKAGASRARLWFIKVYRFCRRRQHWLPVISFIAGVCSFLFVDRQKEMATGILVFLLLTWLFFEAEVWVSQIVKRFWGRALPDFVVGFTAQSLHQETLFFVIPFLFFHTAWNTSHALFTGFVILLACISVLDAVYFPLVARRWVRALLHGFVSFLVIFVSLPQLMLLTTTTSLVIACTIMMLITLPSFFRAVSGHWFKRVGTAVCISLVIGLSVWLLRPIIPPTNFRATVLYPAKSLDAAARIAEPLESTTFTPDFLAGGIYVFSAIRAPRGLEEPIYHTWYWNGKLTDRIELPIVGGREAGFRSWSLKEHFPAEPYGTWQIVVTTSAQQHLGGTRFEVVRGDNEAAEHRDIPLQTPPEPAQTTGSETPDSTVSEPSSGKAETRPETAGVDEPSVSTPNQPDPAGGSDE